MEVRGLKRFFMGCVALLAWAAPASSLVVEEVKWGFDGTVASHRINILSISLSNNSDKNWEGIVRLRRGGTIGNASYGAYISEPVFLGPQSRIWVQFYPFVRSDSYPWSLVWGKSNKERQDLITPKFGPPATVVLQDQGGASMPPRGLKLYPDQLFPTTAAGCDGLGGVVLGHVPRNWTGARRQAFLDWLRGGGVVHLYHGRAGSFPRFSDDMGVLNNPADRFSVGAGVVVRHAVGHGEMSRAALIREGFAPAKMVTSDIGYVARSVDEIIFPRLKQITNPEHSWPLIYLLALLYIVLIGPVNYLFGRKSRDYRKTIGLFFAVVLVFGLLFHTVGRRGFNEETQVHQLSYARTLGDGRFEVDQWMNVFVTSSDDYEMRFNTDSGVVSTCQDSEKVNGVIDNGRGHSFVVDMPLFSNRSFLHKAVYPIFDLSLKAEKIGFGTPNDDGRPLKSLTVKGTLPEGLLQAWVWHEGYVQEMQWSGTTLSLQKNPVKSDDFFVANNYGVYSDWMYENEDESTESAMRRLSRGLIAYGLGGLNVFQGGVERPRSSDTVDVFLLAPSPDVLRLQGEDFSKQDGYVMYHCILSKPRAVGGP